VSSSSLIVVGAGGHAKVIVATARAAGWTVSRIVDDEPARWGATVLGVAVDGASAEILDDADALVVIAVGDNRARAGLARAARCRFATLVHPRAVVDPSVTLGDGTVVFAGAVIQPDARLGRHVIVNTGASIDHDCVLGDLTHVGPGARLAGAVTLGDGVLMGIGSSALPGVAIGAWTTVGAGAAVIAALPAHATAVGVPAQLIGAPRGRLA